MKKTDMITVKYRVIKEYCSCCGREFDEEELGEVEEFNVRVQDIFEWAQWYSSDDIHEEEVSDTVEEYIYDTIRFYALGANETLRLCEGESSKVLGAVFDKIKNNNY